MAYRSVRLTESEQVVTISPYRIVSLNSREGVFVNHTAIMAVISVTIENLILANHLPVTLYAGFRRFSNFVKQQARYERLSQICERIFVCGVADVMPPDIPNVTYVPLSSDMDAAYERFLIVDSVDFFTAVLTRETTSSLSMPSKEQRFKGIWTYEPALINQSILLTAQMLGMPYELTMRRNVEAQSRYLLQIYAQLAEHNADLDKEMAFWQHRDAVMRSGLSASERPLLLIDQRKTVLAASQSAGAILGEDPQTIVGQPLYRCGAGIFAQRDPTEIKAPLMALLTVTDKELLAATSSAITDVQGTNIGWLVSLKHHIYQQPTRYQRRTLPIAPFLRQYSDALEQQIGRLAALASSTTEFQAALVQSQRLITTLNTQITRLTLLQNIEAQGEVRKQAVQIIELLKPVFNESYITARKHRILLRLDLPEGLPRVWCDVEQVRLALRELLNNVWEHAEGCSAVRIQASQEQGYIHLSVQNNGKGLDADDQDRIFRPFASTKAHRTTGEPVGLGLNIARAVAKAHHGHFQIESSVDKGSAFTLLFPALR